MRAPPISEDPCATNEFSQAHISRMRPQRSPRRYCATLLDLHPVEWGRAGSCRSSHLSWRYRTTTTHMLARAICSAHAAASPRAVLTPPAAYASLDPNGRSPYRAVAPTGCHCHLSLLARLRHPDAMAICHLSPSSVVAAKTWPCTLSLGPCSTALDVVTCAR